MPIPTRHPLTDLATPTRPCIPPINIEDQGDTEHQDDGLTPSDVDDSLSFLT